MGDDVNTGELLLGLVSRCNGGVEACFDGVGEAGEHRVGCGIFQLYDEVRVLCGVVFLGVGEDEGSV